MYDVSLHAIRYFCVVAEELHFGRSAERLSITPPSLSQQIRRLESQLGGALFERTSQHVALTDLGREFLPLAERMRDDHRQIIAWAASKDEERRTPALRVGVIAAGAGSSTAEIIARVLERHPTARIEMRRLGFFDARDELESGGVDVAIAPSPLRSAAGVRAEALMREPRVLVVPAGHRLAGRESVSIGETAGEVFVIASNAPSDVIDWWVVDPRPDGSRPRLGTTADSLDGLLDLVAAGAGVNIAGASVAHHHRRDDLVYVPIRDIEPVTISVCTLASSRHPLVDAFRDAARELSSLARGG